MKKPLVLILAITMLVSSTAIYAAEDVSNDGVAGTKQGAE